MSPPAPGLRITRRHMPHWRLEGSVYNVTWHLRKGQPALSPAERTIVADAIRFFHGDRYRLLAFVVMDDHVHVLLHPTGSHSLSSIIHSWKSFTAHKIQKLRSVTGSLWQDESHDRIIRNDDDFQEKLAYIMNNPAKRWPGMTDYPWAEWLPWE